MKNRIFSGIQPSGELHIGNYLGALKDFVELQNSAECYFCVVDLHSLTENFTPGTEKQKEIRDLIIAYLAAGLDPKKCAVFIQSHVPAHAELTWIFNTLVPMGELERMTQFKDKSARQTANINVGLFDYPVLMAADILLYKTTHVPVGQDQLQHLELTNTIARKFNNKFGKTFDEVKIWAPKPLRIMSLTDPDKKMSKSEPNSYIGIFDEPEVIKKKLARAVTATDASGEMPQGVINLFGLLSHFSDPQTLNNFEKQYKDNTIRYSELKDKLAEDIAKYFEPMRQKRKELQENDEYLNSVIAQGAAKASKFANQTLSEVKQKIGLL